MFISMRKRAKFLIISLFLPFLLSGFYINNHCCDIHVVEEEMINYTNQVVVSSGSYEEITKEEYNLLYEMGWPVKDIIISSGYGYREPSCSRCSTYHAGVDFVPGRGEPVLAAMRGVVTEVDDFGAYGVHVIIEHDLHNEVWHTVYAHLQRNSIPANIRPGTEVTIGDLVGRVGNTGISTGPHLHFEIRVDGIRVNPIPVLNKNVPSD